MFPIWTVILICPGRWGQQHPVGSSVREPLPLGWHSNETVQPGLQVSQIANSHVVVPKNGGVTTKIGKIMIWNLETPTWAFI